ncbi:MAG TPA: hypothetical protein PLI18_12790, partial [Pirellulaceae bacterium]|nr:hypothetical protein [Pirellulaceae bacterium]
MIGNQHCRPVFHGEGLAHVSPDRGEMRASPFFVDIAESAQVETRLTDLSGEAERAVARGSADDGQPLGHLLQLVRLSSPERTLLPRTAAFPFDGLSSIDRRETRRARCNWD